MGGPSSLPIYDSHCPCPVFSDSSFLNFFSFLETGSQSVVQAGIQWCDHSSLQPPFLGESDPLTSALQAAEMMCMGHHAVLVIYYWVETGSPVDQACLELLASSILIPCPSKVLGLQVTPLCLSSP